jgi:hypothetical protein
MIAAAPPLGLGRRTIELFEGETEWSKTMGASRPFRAASVRTDLQYWFRSQNDLSKWLHLPI